ncbi:nucleotidyltransferase [Janthinobacterium sp.]|uniref:SMODS domain-containing nucleotidyltransferase n=1 Tax=Janthinobacterium sp. TaxID=1871054 RepID=UPI002582CC0D|nr:nucleotidyltransferase [Janthinobacterium sp.]MCX7293325.1 nucleotidyltransferase [Janthinobacterium sp.]
MSAPLFEQFRANLVVRNASDISTAYSSITTRLNKDFWGLESNVYHRRQVGSYGRGTAIHGISDLDMVFELPWSTYERYRDYQGNGPSQLLQAVRNSLKTLYPNTEIKGDGQVVVIEFKKFVVEVLPAFWDEKCDGYRFGDTHDGGTWKVCKPIKEIAAVNNRNDDTNRNLKHACKMIRAWKNQHGVNMGGLLVDSLVYNFFGQTDDYDAVTYKSYAKLFVSLFTYLGGLDHQEYWAAPGSGQRVHSSGKFQKKAKKAAAKCQEALDADTDKKAIKLYREVFGRSFPAEVPTVIKCEAMAQDFSRYTSEQYIEDEYPVDIRYDFEIDSEVSGDGAAASKLRRMAEAFVWLPKARSLRFYVEHCDVPMPYEVMWKVRNVGAVAERLKMIRGQIVPDGGKMQKYESTNFHGEHFVEAYVVKDGVCVARSLIEVRINE